MLILRRLGVAVTLAIVATACGERLVYEASSDPTIAESDVSTTIATDEFNNNPASGSTTDTTVSSDTISWAACPESPAPFECGQLAVPFDYDNPGTGSFVLSLMRRPAEIPESRIGSLLVNPGGPGFGGTTVAEQAEWYFSTELLEQFDVVGWDPRGTGASTPAVDCTED